MLPCYKISRRAAAPVFLDERLQKKYVKRLPDDYREFLLENNGGFPWPDCVAFTEAGHKTASDVFCFFAIGNKRAWASMEWQFDTYFSRLPKNTVPVARDSCGNLWLLAVGKENAGSVFFWDHGSFGTFDETDLTNPHRSMVIFRPVVWDVGVRPDLVRGGACLVAPLCGTMGSVANDVRVDPFRDFVRLARLALVELAAATAEPPV